MRATKTVAAQKTMATTESIVMNSNILPPPSGNKRQIFPDSCILSFATEDPNLQPEQPSGYQGYQNGRGDENQSNYSYRHQELHHFDHLLNPELKITHWAC